VEQRAIEVEKQRRIVGPGGRRVISHGLTIQRHPKPRKARIEAKSPCLHEILLRLRLRAAWRDPTATVTSRTIQ
jgi:hypothetical protein